MAKSKNNPTDYSVLLDTSFMIRLLNENEPLHPNAEDKLLITSPQCLKQ